MEEQTEVEKGSIHFAKPKKRNKMVATVEPNLATPDNWISSALNSGRTMEEIQQFINMRNQDLKEKARLAFLSAFTKLQEEIPELIKNKAGDRNRYRYAELPMIQKNLRKPIANHGFSIAWDQTEDGDRVTVICILSHSAGHKETSSLSGSPMDVVSNNAEATNAIQKKASLITYLRRYTYTAVLGISSGDKDTDGTVEEKTGIKKPTEQQFKDACKNIASGNWTIPDAEKIYSFSAEQMHTISLLKK